MKSSLPNVKDYARIHPPYASIVLGRDPLVRWHSTRNGALRSALGWSNTRFGDPDKGEERWSSFATRHVAIAVLEPDGTLTIVQEWAPGQEIVR